MNPKYTFGCPTKFEFKIIFSTFDRLEDEDQREDEGQAGDVEEVEDKAEDKGEAGVKMPSHHKRHQEEVVDSCCLKKMQHKTRPIMKHNWW